MELVTRAVPERTRLGASEHLKGRGVDRRDGDEPSVWQAPDRQAAEERVHRLEESAAKLRAAARLDASLTDELEDIHNALALARIDLAAHRRQRAELDMDLRVRRADAVLRQRREVVELFEDSERELLERMAAGRDDVSRRLDAVRADLLMAREKLDDASAARQRLDLRGLG
jgi:hypothetical protein